MHPLQGDVSSFVLFGTEYHAEAGRSVWNVKFYLKVFRPVTPA